MMENVLVRLNRGEVIVGDGAWGTLLMQRSLKSGDSPESVNLTQPEVIAEIASLYVDAGAEIVTTNTFGGSPLKLMLFSLQDRTEEINRSAVEEARRAVGKRAYVSASVGPTGRLLKPLGDIDPEEMRAGFDRQIAALLGAGADMICVETMTDLQEAVLAVKAARSQAPRIPIMATMTFEQNPRGFFTIMGVSVEKAVHGLEEAGSDIVGSNCGYGIETMTGIAREFRRVSSRPIAIQANAGLPVLRDGATLYPETPEFFADKAPDLLDAGVQIIGGCCGTGPDHIRALRRVVDARSTGKRGSQE